MSATGKKQVGLVGARGYVGQELIRLLAPHPGFEVAFASSRALAGQRLEGCACSFENLDAEAVAYRSADILVLALPNDLSAPFVDAVHAKRPETIIIDLSGDHRFDGDWVYGLPELACSNEASPCLGVELGLSQDFGRSSIKTATRIANPGCYATAMMLALWPMRDRIGGTPSCFGVSGYSGAGTSPSRKNDLAILKDNLIPYALKGHLHEKEVGRHLGHPISFSPHVAAFFRGLSVTTHIPLASHMTMAQVMTDYEAAYRGEKFVNLNFDAPPEISCVRNTHMAQVGGLTLAEDGMSLAVVSVIDNLLKGAASQALQNMNLACGYLEGTGLEN